VYGLKDKKFRVRRRGEMRMEGERGEKKGKERTKSEKGCFIPIIISVYVIVLIFPNISLIIQQVLERKIFIQLLKNEKFTGPILSNT